MTIFDVALMLGMGVLVYITYELLRFEPLNN